MSYFFNIFLSYSKRQACEWKRNSSVPTNKGSNNSSLTISWMNKRERFHYIHFEITTPSHETMALGKINEKDGKNKISCLNYTHWRWISGLAFLVTPTGSGSDLCIAAWLHYPGRLCALDDI
jgi:hypothetical protein